MSAYINKKFEPQGKKISIITVNYNQPEVTEALLRSIDNTNSYSDFEMIVVDNGSKENPIPKWSNQYPKVKFVRSEINLGFAGGNNIGIAEADGDYFFLVNNDTEFAAGLLGTLVKTFEDFPDTGVVCPKIMYFEEKNIIQYLGFTDLNLITARNKCIGQYTYDHGQFDNQISITAFAHGAAMMISRQVLDVVGQMDDIFFLYYEEFDWSLRIRYAAFKIRVNSGACIYHKESISVGVDSALKVYYMNRNRIFLLRRHASSIQFILFVLYFGLIVFPRNIIKYLIDGRLDNVKAISKSIAWNFRNKSTARLFSP